MMMCRSSKFRKLNFKRWHWLTADFGLVCAVVVPITGCSSGSDNGSNTSAGGSRSTVIAAGGTAPGGTAARGGSTSGAMTSLGSTSGTVSGGSSYLSGNNESNVGGAIGSGTNASGGVISTNSSARGGTSATSRSQSTTSGGTSGNSAKGGSTAVSGGTNASAGSAGQGGATASGAGGASAGKGGTLATAGAPACDPGKRPAITKLGLSTVVQSSKINILVYAAQPPGSNDWYLVDVLGYVYVYSNGVLQTTPFLDVSTEVKDTTYQSLKYDERGLLSIAFAPDYATSGKFYVALVPTSTATEDHDLVLEYKRSSTNPLVADTTTRKAILDLEPGGVDGSGYNPNATGADLNKYHNASTVLFGPDGMLYVGLGDGGGQCNSARPGVPQDVSSPYGKILRLNPNAAPPYAAAGNPFTNSGDPRVLHWGLRNPFRFGFDSLTGDLFIGDVGQWDYEEISYAPAGSQGLNFGWPDYEGNDPDSCNTNVKLAAGATHTPPITTIAHPSGSGASTLVYAIVAGTVYRGTAIPALYGTFLFGEYYANHDMRALYQCGNRTSEVLTIHKQCDLNQPNDACFTPVGNTPQLAEVGAIVQGNDGELYLAANNNALLKIVAAP